MRCNLTRAIARISWAALFCLALSNCATLGARRLATIPGRIVDQTFLEGPGFAVSDRCLRIESTSVVRRYPMTTSGLRDSAAARFESAPVTIYVSFDRLRSSDLTIVAPAGDHGCSRNDVYSPASVAELTELRDHVYFPEFAVAIPYGQYPPLAAEQLSTAGAASSPLVRAQRNPAGKIELLLAGESSVVYATDFKDMNGWTAIVLKGVRQQPLSEGVIAPQMRRVPIRRPTPLRVRRIRAEPNSVLVAFQSGEPSGQLDVFRVSGVPGANGREMLAVASHRTDRRDPTRLGYLFMPLTLPIDLITAPIQILVFWERYLLIVGCALGSSCKTPLG